MFSLSKLKAARHFVISQFVLASFLGLPIVQFLIKNKNWVVGRPGNEAKFVLAKSEKQLISPYNVSAFEGCSQHLHSSVY